MRSACIFNIYDFNLFLNDEHLVIQNCYKILADKDKIKVRKFFISFYNLKIEMSSRIKEKDLLDCSIMTMCKHAIQ